MRLESLSFGPMENLPWNGFVRAASDYEGNEGIRIVMSTRDLAEVYAAESKYRLRPHRQPQRSSRPHRLPLIRRNGDSLTSRIGDLIPRETLDALYLIASPSSLIH